MDLTKVRRIVQKNFKDHNVKSDLDEETLLYFICVDLVREDMNESAPAPTRPARKKNDVVPGQMSLVDNDA